MAQAAPTTCGHNAPGQVLVPGRPTICRQCGTRIQPTPRAGNIASEKQVNAIYPERFDGGNQTAEQTWAFAQ